MLSSGVKDTDHEANSSLIAAPLGDYSRPFTKVRRESVAYSFFFHFGSFILFNKTLSLLFCLPSLFLSVHFSLVLSTDTHQGNTSLKLPDRCLKPFVSCARQKAADGFQRLRLALSYGSLSMRPVRADCLKYDAGSIR